MGVIFSGEFRLFNRELWEGLCGFTAAGSYPKLPCPYCNSENLLIDVDSLQTRGLSGAALQSYIDNFQFKNLKEAIGGDNNWVKLLAGLVDVADSVQYSPSQFVAFFKCSMCCESVSSIGIAKTPRDNSKGYLQIKVESFSPPVSMFPLNTITPKSINEELLGAFCYFHSDASSSGNKLRRAIEKLCKELGFNYGVLHRNIEAMSKIYPQEASWLEPLKLVGNEAAHADGIYQSDLLDSFQVFEVVLDIFRRKEVEYKTAKTVEKLEKRFKKNITNQASGTPKGGAPS